MRQLQSLFENKYFSFFSLALIVIAVFSPAFTAGFIPWDDKEYIIENPHIHSLGVKNIFAFFSSSYIGNYHPITMLSYAFDFFFAGEKAFGYHLTNIIFHFLNGFLVFLFVRKLIGNSVFSYVASVIFLVHPVQSETVMWIAERKNVFYVFFYLLASISYIKYLESDRNKYYWVTLLTFVFSCLSKATAVTFPLVMLIIDLCMGKEIFSKKQFLKIPFFLLSLAIGLLAVYFQKEDGFINSAHNFGMLKNTLFASHALITYIVKFLLPVHLSSYYPYPETIGVLQWLSLFIAISIIFLAVYLLKNRQYVFALGMLFFLVNIAPVLQFIPFGQVLVAERYNYLPMLGMVIVSAKFFQIISQKSQNLRRTFSVLIPVILIVFGMLSFTRNKIWQNSFVFYGDILKKFPRSEVIQNSLGAEYMIAGDYEKARECFGKAKSINPKNYSIFYNEGLCWLKQGDLEKAYQSLSECIDVFPYHKAFFARASILEQSRQYKKAIDDLDAVIIKKPDFDKAFHLRGLCKEKSGRIDEAIADYQKAVGLNPEEALFHLNLGIALAKKGETEGAINEFDTAIILKPDYAQAYYSRAIAKHNLKKNPCEDLKAAMKLGLKEAEDAAIRICR